MVRKLDSGAMLRINRALIINHVNIKKSCYRIKTETTLLLLLLLLKKLAMQGREREIDTLSVRRPQPHTTNL